MKLRSIDRKKFRVRNKVKKVSKVDRFRLSISRSSKNISAQKKFSNYLNENFGFRNVFVRLNNELNFRLYDEINAKNVILGKDDYLFEENYILTYKGKDFIGSQQIEEKVNKLKELWRTIKVWFARMYNQFRSAYARHTSNNRNRSSNEPSMAPAASHVNRGMKSFAFSSATPSFCLISSMIRASAAAS